MFEEVGACVGVDGFDGNPVTQAARFAPDVLQRGRFCSGAVQAQHEDLVFFDLAAAGHDLRHKRAAGFEAKLTWTGERVARVGFEPVFQRDGTAHAGREVLREVEGPGFIVDPMSGTRRCSPAAMYLCRRFGCGVSERDHGFVEFDDHLAHLRDLALWRHAQRAGGVGAMRGAQQAHGEHGKNGKHRQWPALFFYVADHRTRSRVAKTLAILPECYVILANCFHFATRWCELIASSARLCRL
jgi:hypothetical protein